MKYPDIKAPKEQLTVREKISQWWWGTMVPFLQAIAFPAIMIAVIVLIFFIQYWRIKCQA